MSQVKNKKYSKRKQHHYRWPSLLIIGGGLVLLFGAIYALTRPRQSTQDIQTKAPIEVSGAPSLKVDRDTINLGDINLGRTVNVSFLLTNVGDKPLKFSKIPYIEVKEGC